MVLFSYPDGSYFLVEGAGAMNLAKAVEAASNEKSNFAFLYDLKVSLASFTSPKS